VLLAAGLAGYLVGPCNMWQRVFLVVAAFGLIDPNLWTDISGAVLTAIVVATQLAAQRRIAEMAPRPGE
jgi:TRAP-type uncharacterized transport system fused permease subunit